MSLQLDDGFDLPLPTTAAAKPKKKSRTSPTQRSLAELKKRGCVCQVVEHWNAFAKIRVDLFGIIDVIALSPDGETIGVQATSHTNVAARIRKIGESDHIAALRKCGWRILVHGWGKRANGRYELREVDVS